MIQIVTDKNKITEFLDSRYIEAVFPSKEKAVEIMGSGKRLVFYLGIDPTGPDIHLGHTTNLIILKKLIELGHEVILLIGDFTARIGDPSGKDTVRKPLTEKDVRENMKNYLEQAHKILVRGSFKTKHNSEWLKKMSFEDVVKLASHFTVQQMITRDMFQRRLTEQKPIGLHEFLYPLMQGYDSVAMEVDGEIGGNDQTFNMLAGRDLAREFLGKDKIVLTTRLLEDADTGKKIMNKSEGQYISLNDSAKDMFGKIMAMPDSAIMPLFSYTTEVSDEKINEVKSRLEKGENPKAIKEELAFELVRMYHGEKEAEKAREEFRKVFSEGQLPEEIEEIPNGQTILQTMVVSGFIPSRSEAKRLIEQKAVSVNDKVIESWDYKIEKGDIIKVGPRKFRRVK